MLAVQLAPPANVAGGIGRLVGCWKSPALRPVRSMLVSVIGTPLLLVNRNTPAGLLVFTSWVANLYARVGPRVMPTCPLPTNSAPVELPSLPLTSTCPAKFCDRSHHCEPTGWGLKITAILQLEFAATELPQVPVPSE